ncbi:MAG: tRNA-dihydrouridine synthase [Candidatus Gracilibacteria bacterium]|nr:tRNA-dihydrouridine synthase [Candidatus Gracilibacteria bacterium]
MNKDFWIEQTKKGPIVALAPMDGFTDSAYRQVVKGINKDVICFSEFFSADGIVHSKFLADSVLPHNEIEKPLIIQIFGKDPEIFKKAAIIIETYGISGIDVNMGCPAKKVVRSGHGSSLMINTDTAFRIIEEMSKAVKIPVSVKTRLGWDNWENLIDFAKGLENAGANLITVHGRTYKQAYQGSADWTGIHELKKNLKIPVIGNGDVECYDDGMNKIKDLDGFMIGRKSFGNPWCFLPGEYKPTLSEILETMEKHARILIELKGRKGSLESRKHMVQYLHSFPGVKNYRKKLVMVDDFQDVQNVLNEIRSEYSEFLDSKLNEIII